MRYGLHVDPLNKNLYIMEYLFVVLSVRVATTSPFPLVIGHLVIKTHYIKTKSKSNQPCAFIAADYVLLGRLARHLGCGQLLLISPHKITYAYVASDISTFLIQAIGGSISVSSNSYNRGILGSRVSRPLLCIRICVLTGWVGACCCCCCRSSWAAWRRSFFRS